MASISLGINPADAKSVERLAAAFDKFGSSANMSAKELKMFETAAAQVISTVTGLKISSPFSDLAKDTKIASTTVGKLKAELTSLGTVMRKASKDTMFMQEVSDAKALEMVALKVNAEFERMAKLKADILVLSNKGGGGSRITLNTIKKETAELEKQLVILDRINSKRAAPTKAGAFKVYFSAIDKYAESLKKLESTGKASSQIAKLRSELEKLDAAAQGGKVSPARLRGINKEIQAIERLIAAKSKLTSGHGVAETRSYDAQIRAIDKLQSRLSKLSSTKMPRNQIDSFRKSIIDLRSALNSDVGVNTRTGIASISSKLNVLEKDFGKTKRVATDWGKSLKYSIGGVARSMGAMTYSYSMLAPLIAGMAAGSAVKNVFKLGAAFEYATVFATSLNDSLSSMNAGELQKALLAMDGLRTGPDELALGMKEFAKAGDSMTDSLEQIGTMSKFASIAELDLSSSIKLIIGQSRAFGIEYADAANMIAAAALSSATDIKELAGALSYTTELATVSGVKFHEVATALAIMANAGIRKSKAATAIRTSIIKMQAPSEKLKKTLDALGISWSAFTDKGQIKDLRTMFSELKRVTDKLTPQQRVGIFKELFGLRAIKGGANILKSMSGDWDKLDEKIKSAGSGIGFVAKEYEKLSDTATAKLDLLKAEFQKTLIKSFDSDATKSMLDMLKDVVGSKDAVNAISAVISGIEALGLALGGLFKLGEMLPGDIVDVGLVGYIIFGSNPYGRLVIGLLEVTKLLNEMDKDSRKTLQKGIDTQWEVLTSKYDKLLATTKTGAEAEKVLADFNKDRAGLYFLAAQAGNSFGDMWEELKNYAQALTGVNTEAENTQKILAKKKMKFTVPIDTTEIDKLRKSLSELGVEDFGGPIYNSLVSKIHKALTDAGAELDGFQWQTGKGIEIFDEKSLQNQIDDLAIIGDALANIEYKGAIEGATEWQQKLEKIKAETDKIVAKSEADYAKTGQGSAKVSAQGRKQIFDALKLNEVNKVIGGIKKNIEETNFSNMISGLKKSGSIADNLKAELMEIRRNANKKLAKGNLVGTDFGFEFIKNQQSAAIAKAKEAMDALYTGVQDSIDKINHDSWLNSLDAYDKKLQEIDDKVTNNSFIKKLGIEANIDTSKLGNLDEFIDINSMVGDTGVLDTATQKLIDNIARLREAYRNAMDTSNVKAMKAETDKLNANTIIKGLEASNSLSDQLKGKYESLKTKAYEAAKALGLAGEWSGEIKFSPEALRNFDALVRNSRMFEDSLKAAKDAARSLKDELSDMGRTQVSTLRDLQAKLISNDSAKAAFKWKGDIADLREIQRVIKATDDSSIEGAKRKKKLLAEAVSMTLALDTKSTGSSRYDKRIKELTELQRNLRATSAEGKTARKHRAAQLRQIAKELSKVKEAQSAASGQEDTQKVKAQIAIYKSLAEQQRDLTKGQKERADKEVSNIEAQKKGFEKYVASIKDGYSGTGEAAVDYGKIVVENTNRTAVWGDMTAKALKKIKEAYLDAEGSFGKIIDTSTGDVETWGNTSVANIKKVKSGMSSAEKTAGAYGKIIDINTGKTRTWGSTSVKNINNVTAAYREAAKAAASINPPSASGVSGHRAVGGPVASGSTYLVGEKGPELFTPNRSGAIIPNNKLSSRNTVNINLSLNNSPPVQVQGSTQTVEELQRMFNENMRNAA